MVLCAGCAEGLLGEDGTQHCTRRIELSGEIDQVAVTRVNDGGFCDGDGMGIYIVDYKAGTPGTLQQSGNRADNVCYTYDEAKRKWNSDYDVYWKDNHTNIDVYGYYPYAKSVSIDNYTFNVQRDQSTATADGKMGGYEASDFLWGKLSDVAPTSAALRLLLRHRMSSACVKLLKGEGFTDSEWESMDKTVFVTNLARKASINMTDGTVKVAGDVEKLATIPSQVNDEWRAIVVPQTVPAGITLFNIYIGGAPYKFAKNEAFTYVSGKMMKFNIRVDKPEGSGKYRLTLVSESIAPWENDLQSHDAMATEYVVINSTAGHLKDSIVASYKDIAMVKRMKLTGTINAHDFEMMCDSMPRLTALNLKDVRIKGYDNNGKDDDEIPHDCLSEKKTLTSVVLPDVLKRIGSSAFADSGLKYSLNIPEGVVEIGYYAFRHTDLTGILTLPSTLKKIGMDAFAECCFICPLNLPDGIEEIEDGCFDGCSYLYGNLILPSHLKTLGYGAFRGCYSLKGDLVIPKSLTDIPSEAFDGCRLGGRLLLHDGITTIGESAFSDNGFAGEVEIPNGVTLIRKRVFAECKNIQKVILPSELRVIDEEAFNNCKSLRVIECKSTVPPLVSMSAFNGVPLQDLTVIVPKSALNDYKSSDFWSDLLLKTVE